MRTSKVLAASIAPPYALPTRWPSGLLAVPARGTTECSTLALLDGQSRHSPALRRPAGDADRSRHERREKPLSKVLYTAAAHVTGGRAEGHGRSSDGQLEVDLRTPTEMGGEGGGTNPEQLFAVGYAACFEGALGVVGKRRRVELGEVAIDSRVSLVTTEERGFNVAVELHVSLPSVDDPEQAAAIVADAHQVCPYSNATRGNVEVTLTANGEPVGS